METPIVIDILDRFGKVRERHKLNKFPVRIGRSYRNDVIIDDQYISPQNLEILLDGGGHVLINDLKSENGVYTLHPLKRHDVLQAEDNIRIRIGHTEMRIRSENYPVNETFIDHAKPSQWHLMMTNILLLPVVFLIFAAILAGDQYVQATRDITTNQIIGAILPVLIVVGAWCFIWSIVSKIVAHAFYFSYHAILACGLFSVFYFIETSFEYIEFNLPNSGLDYLLTIGTDLAFAGLLFYGHLRQSTHFGRRKTRKIAAIATAVIVGLAHVFVYVSQPQFNEDPVYSVFIKPPAFAVTSAHSINDFFEGTEQLAKFDIERDEK